MMEESMCGLEELLGVPRYHPLYKSKVQAFLAENELGSDADAVAACRAEMQEYDLNALYLYSRLAGTKELSTGLLKSALEERNDLLALYRALGNTTECATVESLCAQAIKDVNSEGFWRSYFFLFLHLQTNVYDFSQRASLCKQILQLELCALKQKQEMSKSTGVEYLESFAKYYGTDEAAHLEIESLKCRFLNSSNKAKVCAYVADYTVAQKIDVFAKCDNWLGSMTLAQLYNLWMHDKSIVSCLSEKNRESLREEVSALFLRVSDDVIAYDFLDLETRSAVNAAIRGVSIPEIRESLDKFLDCIEMYVESFYTEFVKICEVTIKKCEEIHFYGEEKNA